jgi:hypothetical protein
MPPVDRFTSWFDDHWCVNMGQGRSIENGFEAALEVEVSGAVLPLKSSSSRKPSTSASSLRKSSAGRSVGGGVDALRAGAPNAVKTSSSASARYPSAAASLGFLGVFFSLSSINSMPYLCLDLFFSSASSERMSLAQDSSALSLIRSVCSPPSESPWPASSSRSLSSSSKRKPLP